MVAILPCITQSNSANHSLGCHSALHHTIKLSQSLTWLPFCPASHNKTQPITHLVAILPCITQSNSANHSLGCHSALHHTIKLSQSLTWLPFCPASHNQTQPITHLVAILPCITQSNSANHSLGCHSALHHTIKLSQSLTWWPFCPASHNQTPLITHLVAILSSVSIEASSSTVLRPANSPLSSTPIS